MSHMHIEKSLRKDLLSDPFRLRVMRLKKWMWKKKEKVESWKERNIEENFIRTKTQLRTRLEIEIFLRFLFLSLSIRRKSFQVVKLSTT